MSEAHPNLTCALETITPELAQQLIDSMTSPWRIHRRRVDQFAKDMLAGRWIINGSTITISHQGELLDGLQRLTAITLADLPVQMVVIRGVDKDQWWSM